MPAPPLSDHVANQLQDPTTALAVAVVIASLHPEVLQWVVGFATPPAEPVWRRSGGHRKPRNNARLAKREIDDQALVKAMRSNSEGSINDWATTISKSQTSCVSALQRLRDAGLAESLEGKWKLDGPEAPRETAAKWIEPLSATAGRERRALASA